jgi:hypothetical protein
MLGNRGEVGARRQLLVCKAQDSSSLVRAPLLEQEVTQIHARLFVHSTALRYGGGR